MIKIKGSEFSYLGNGVLNCYFMAFSSDPKMPICLVNDYNQTVSPVHGYYYPNMASRAINCLAKKLGYANKDPHFIKTENLKLF